MLCLPGFTPVAKLAQATGDSDGWVVSSFENVPESASLFRFGSLPSSMNFRARVGSMPSKPMMKTRCLLRRSGLPEGPLEQPESEHAHTVAPTRRVRDQDISTSESCKGRPARG